MKKARNDSCDDYKNALLLLEQISNEYGIKNSQDLSNEEAINQLLTLVQKELEEYNQFSQLVVFNRKLNTLKNICQALDIIGYKQHETYQLYDANLTYFYELITNLHDEISHNLTKNRITCASKSIRVLMQINNTVAQDHYGTAIDALRNNFSCKLNSIYEFSSLRRDNILSQLCRIDMMMAEYTHQLEDINSYEIQIKTTEIAAKSKQIKDNFTRLTKQLQTYLNRKIQRYQFSEMFNHLQPLSDTDYQFIVYDFDYESLLKECIKKCHEIVEREFKVISKCDVTELYKFPIKHFHEGLNQLSQHDTQFEPYMCRLTDILIQKVKQLSLNYSDTERTEFFQELDVIFNALPQSLSEKVKISLENSTSASESTPKNQSFLITARRRFGLFDETQTTKIETRGKAQVAFDQCIECLVQLSEASPGLQQVIHDVQSTLTEAYLAEHDNMKNRQF